MKTLASSLLLAVLALFSSTPAGAESPTATGPSGAQAELGTVKIVGGGPADPGAHRWIVSLQRGGHFCGASLIADRWVLTAAHCLIGEKAKGLKVWIGGHDLRRPGEGVSAKVEKIHLHPKYNDDTLRNDIALLELTAPVTAAITRASLASSQLAKPGEMATVSGWGALSESGGSPKVLHEVRLPIVANSECNSPAAYGGEVVSSQVCAGLREGGKDACYGDSGGPLWLSSGGKDHVVGVVSWGEGCAEPRKYGVYTRVASFEGWIDSKLAGGGDPDPGPDTGPGPAPGPGASCRGSCGDNAGSCWCDEDCVFLGDCCSDYEAVCADTQDSCTEAVCAIDPYCCNVKWDRQCKRLARDIC